MPNNNLAPAIIVPSAPSLGKLARGSRNPVDVLVAAWLAGYKSPHTRSCYVTGVRFWRLWCDQNDVDVLQAIRAHVDLWQRTVEAEGKAPRTVASRLAAVASFYNYLLDQGVITHDPMRGVRRPQIERRSPSAWLSSGQVFDLLTAATEMGPHPAALLHILALNGLRIGEACSLDVASLGWDGYHPTLTFTRKGGKDGLAVLSRPTEAAVRTAIGDRSSGPMLLNWSGRRMNRECAQRILDRLMPSVRGQHGRITPHCLRHSWTTICLDAYVTTDQVQHDGGWADPRNVTYYGHGHSAPARAATHAASAWVYGAA